ncbi:MAG: hypothetical protein DLM60_07310 [Pseudonocardiales bacterium]|nr:MAG: hypothetical protein DLM60_07310 [Pseudonocardiales bacterium]
MVQRPRRGRGRHRHHRQPADHRGRLRRLVQHHLRGDRRQPRETHPRLLATTPRPGDGSRHPRLQLAGSQHRARSQTTRCAVLASPMATRLHRPPEPRVDPRRLPR